MLVDEFEGEKVRYFRGKLPAIPLEMPEGYPRGTHVIFQIETRVARVGYDEITARKDERRGELIREHQLVVEEVALVGAKTASQADPGIGGSASNRVEERDDFDFGAEADCYYDRAELEVVHRGGCELCEKRTPWYALPAPPGPVTEEEFLEAAGLKRREPVVEHDVDF